MSDNRLILIIDNDDRSARTAKDAMESMCSNSLQIVSSLERARQITRSEPVVFMIVNLEIDESDALDFIKEVRQNSENPNYKSPIIALSAQNNDAIKKTAKNAGVTELLTKPFGPQALKDAIVNIMNNPRNFIMAAGHYIGPDRRERNDDPDEEDKRGKR